jgi:GT2 family glycosyltransferase
MRRRFFLSGLNPRMETQVESQSESERKINALKKSLQEQISAKNELERELYEIKTSLAWRVVMRCRHLRNILLGEDTRRRKSYNLTRDMLKGAVLLASGKASVRLRDMPYIADRVFQALRTEGLNGAARLIKNRLEVGYEYSQWIERYDKLSSGDRAAIKRDCEALPYKPLISVLMPTFNTPEKWLRLAIESVRAQLYPHWELCIADDASADPRVRRVLDEYKTQDKRIKVVLREMRGHISAASNSALEVAEGDFVALLDHDDELREHSLYMLAAELNAHPDAHLIYSDEDKIDQEGTRYGPYFKPDWNPTLFLGQNFVCHLVALRTILVRETGGFSSGYEGAQDWDLVMRVIERIPDDHVRHIPHVLYHWRAIPGSTAAAETEKKYALHAQRKTIEAHFERVGTADKSVEVLPTAAIYWRIKYRLCEPFPEVTLIVPTRNGFDLLQRCVESIYRKTSYRNFKLLIVDNQSNEAKTLEYLIYLETQGRARVLRYDAPFNFSAINNFAVRHTKSEIVGFLNNDLEVITPDWLDEMVRYAIQPDIGAVGAKLYFPNNTIQHAGVILGVGGLPGVAGHISKGRPRSYPGQASRALLAQDMSAVTGACLIVRRNIFQEVGGMDEENLPIAFNDIDLCLRIRERGYRNVWTPFAELYHYESSSRGYEDTPEKVNRFNQESDFMKQRWGEVLLSDPAYNPNLALDREPFLLAFPPRAAKPWLLEVAEYELNRE